MSIISENFLIDVKELKEIKNNQTKNENENYMKKYNKIKKEIAENKVKSNISDFHEILSKRLLNLFVSKKI